MKKMNRVLIILIVIIILGALVYFGVNYYNNNNANNVRSATLTNTEATTSTNTPTSDPVVIDPDAYVNEMFGYAISLPDNYTSKVSENRTDDPKLYDHDTVTIMDEEEEVFAMIWTPEEQMELDEWTVVEEKDIPVAGNSKILTWTKLEPTTGGEETMGIITVSWGDALEDFLGTGFMTHDFDPEDESTIETFEEMVMTFQFL